MAHYVHRDSTAGFAQGKPVSWRAWFNAAAGLAQALLTRWRQRQELLDYMSFDPRAASDIGVPSHDAREWAKRPFWRD